ncbi:MAG: carboxypeptidase regulatory-like domain-containing protein [Nitrospirota bacterium]
MLTVLLAGLATPAFAQQPSPSLATVEFYLVGGQLAPQPGYQAVPKSLTTQVDVPFVLPDRVTSAGVTFAELQLLLPQDLIVRAELRGPAFASPIQLSALPNHPLELPTLPVTGIYTVENIRMESAGQVVAASPNVVQVESFEKALVTQVTTRQLTAQEIADRGIAIDASNFNVVNFTAALSFQSRPVQLQIPIAVPVIGRSEIEEPPPTNLGDLAAVVQTGPQGQPIPVLNRDEVIPNLQIQTFQLDSIQGSVDKDPQFPPISGIVVIPGSIGYLHQFFEATLLVTNGAPASSALSIRDVQAAIVLPTGLDRIAGTDAAPGDDPLRAVGTTATGGVPLRTLPVRAPGPDGQFGTPDDVEVFGAQQTGQVAFTLEGLKEGTHSIEFAITATLEGLPRGPVQISGKATGAVLVRNPNFAITLSHPSTVRAGVEYTLTATVSNTSDVAANLVQVTLDPHAVSGATLLSASTVQIQTLAPHTAGTVSFRLRSQVTGKVTATVFPTDDQVKGSFILRAGVGANNIPLSPDTLVLSSFADYLPDPVRLAAVGFLGEAYSVSTAPAGSLPTGIARIARKTVQTGAANVGEGGLRIFLGEAPEQSLHTLLLDVLGSDTPDPALDGLRRISPLAEELAAAVGAELAPAVAAQGALALQRALATGATDRGPYWSIMTAGLGGPAAAVQVRDAFGRVLGGETTADPAPGIPYAELVPIGPPDAPDAVLAVHSAPANGSYLVEWRPTADGALDLGIVLPGANGLEQVTFAGVSVAATDRLLLTIAIPRTDPPTIGVDHDGDGVAEVTLAPTAISAVPDPGPMLEGAVQLFDFDDTKLDKYGRLVAVLMSKRLVKDQAQALATYAVDDNAVLTALLQPSGRVVFVGLRDPIGPYIERRLTVTGLTDRRGVAMQPASQSAIIRSTATEPGAVVQGRVLTADGQPVTTARISLVYAAQSGNLFGDVSNVRIGTKPVDADGGYHYDYASSRFSEGGTGFLVRAEDPATGRFVELATQERFAGQRMTLDLIFPGQGTVTGVVRDDQGRLLSGAAVTVRSTVSGLGALTTTDPSGRYTVGNIPVGNVLVAATASGGYYGAVNGTLTGDGGTAVVDVVLFPPLARPEGRVIGTVYADDGITPLGNIPVVVTVAAVSYQNFVRTAADGTFAFERVPTGGLVVEAIDPATGNRARAASTLAAGETASLTVIFNALGSISGTVYTQFGVPVSGALVVANGKSFAFTGADGTYTIAGVPLGSVSVRAEDSQGRTGSASTSLSFPGQAATAVIYLTSGLRASIVGTVYERDGVTVAPNLPVRVIVDIEYNCLAAASCPPTYKVLQTTTDAQGGYRIDGIPIPPRVSTAIAVRGSNAEVGNAAFRLVSEGQVVKTDIVLTGPGTVTGTVRDQGSANQPTGANVIVRGVKPNEAGLFEQRLIGTTQADAQTGRFSVAGAWPGGFSVEASNTFRPNPARASGAIRFAGDVQDVTLTLIPNAGSISGVVNKPDGTPVGEGVQVRLTLAGSPVTVTTGPDGRFQFAPILPASTYPLTAEDPVSGLRGIGSAVVQGGQDTPVTLRLLGLGSVVAQVRNADGSPTSQASVNLRRTSFPYDTASATLGPADGGNVAFSNITEGDFSVEAVDPNGLGARASGRVPGEGQTATVTLTLSPSGVVTGRLLTPDGRTPIGNGQIQLTQYGRAIGFLTTSTDPATLGAYRFEHVPLGPIVVEGFDPVTSRRGKGFGQLASNGQTLVVDVLQIARGTVTGRALSADGTRPVEGGKMTLQVSGVFSESFQGLTTPDGGFAFPGVPAGNFTVRLEDPLTGLTGSASGKVVLEGETVTTEVRLEPTGTVSATVVKFDGVTPASGATVVLRGPRTTHTIQADPEGRISRSLSPLGHYTLTATSPNGLDGGTANADLATEGQVADVLVRLNGVGSVEGTVYESDGLTPAVGALVTLAVRGVVSANFSFQTGSDGRYLFASVPAGTLSLSVKSPDGLLGGSASGTLARDGETVTIDLSYQAAGTVMGQVIAPDGVTPSAGAILTVRVGSITLSIVAANDGRFTVESIPLGTVSIDVIEAFGQGVAYRTQALTANGQVIDVGAIVLDNAPIRVAEVQPVDGAVNVGVTAPLSIVFSEAADPATITTSTVRLFEGSTTLGLSRTLSADHTRLTLTPTQALKGSTRYTLVVTTGVRDFARHPLPVEVRTTFVTLDNVPPTVVSISPAHNTIQVDPSAVVRVVFSEPVDPATVSLALARSGLSIAGRVDLAQNNTVAIFTPADVLATNATYTASVSGVIDLAGNVLAAPVSATFDTLDIVPPTVTGLSLPSGVSLIRGRTVTATATVADGDVASVEFTVDDRLVATDTAAPFAAAVSLTPLSGDTLVLKAIAVDRVGNRSAPLFLSVTVLPDELPSATMSAPTTAEVGATVSVTVTAQDDVGIASVKLVASGAATSTQTRTFATQNPVSATFSLAVPASAAPGTGISLVATATDSAGGTANASASLTVVDTKAPTVTITAPTTTQVVTGSTITVTVNAADTVGVSRIELAASAGTITSPNPVMVSPAATTASASFTLVIDAGVPVGQAVTLTAKADDTSGNRSAGTTRSLTVVPVVPSLTAIEAAPASGTAAQAAPATNLGQTISIVGSDLRPDVRVRFTTRTDTGNASTQDVSVVDGSVSADQTRAQVVVPAASAVATGPVVLYDPASGMLSQSVHLQVVPTVTILDAPVFAPEQPMTIRGSGFAENRGTVVFQPAAGNPVSVVDVAAEIDVQATNGAMVLTIPNGAGSGDLVVTTDGGSSAPFAFVVPTLTALSATAATGTPADPARRSANVGQTVGVVGEGLSGTVALRVPTLSDTKVAGTLNLPLTQVSTDGASAQAVLDPQGSVTTGSVRLIDTATGVGSAESVWLQIVPTLDPPSAATFGTAQPLTLTGSGLIEDGLTLHFPKVGGGVIDVADTGANMDVTNKNRAVSLLSPSGVGPGSLTVTTAGGTSAPVTIAGSSAGASSLAISPNPLSVAPGGTASITVGVPTADSFDRTVALSTADPSVATVPASVVLPGGTTQTAVLVSGVAQGSTTLRADLSNADGSVVSASAPVYVAPPFAGSALAYTEVGVYVEELAPGSSSVSIRSAPVGVVLSARDPAGASSVRAADVGVTLVQPEGTSAVAVLGPPVGLAVAETVTGVSHATLAQGESVTFRVVGTDLSRVTTLAFDPPTGLTVVNPPVIDADGRGLSATVTVSSTAAEGLRKVQVLTATGPIRPAVPEAATVTITKPAPEITAVTPGTAMPGDTITLTITGRRLTGAISVTIAPATGFTVQNPPDVSPDGTQATVTVTVDSSVAAGTYRVSISTPVGSSSGTMTEANDLVVTAP